MKIKKPYFITETTKKFKPIRDLVKKKGVLKFSTKMTFYLEGVSEPLVIAMNGERTDSDEWDLQMPRSSTLGQLEPAGELCEKLIAVEVSVRNYISKYSLKTKWLGWERVIRRGMRSGLSTEYLEFRSVLSMQAIAGRGYDAHFYAPIMAIAHVIEGIEALKRNDLDHASHCAQRGLYWSSPIMLIPDPAKRFVARARKGGQATGRSRNPVKEETARLIKALAPAEGWESTKIAIDAVAHYLNDNHYQLVESCNLMLENLPRTIEGWLVLEPERFPHRVKPRQKA
ncbi:hypothetical protein ACV229_20595 [Burkholderia sp. MR1-5-21]